MHQIKLNLAYHKNLIGEWVISVGKQERDTKIRLRSITVHLLEQERVISLRLHLASD